jgi:hypothetical protein
VVCKSYSEIISRIRVISEPLLNEEKKTNLGQDGLLWRAYLQFNSSWKDTDNIIQEHICTSYIMYRHLIRFYKKWEPITEKGLLTHLIRTVQIMYKNTTNIIREDRVNDTTHVTTNIGVRHGSLTVS